MRRWCDGKKVSLPSDFRLGKLRRTDTQRQRWMQSLQWAGWPVKDPPRFDGAMVRSGSRPRPCGLELDGCGSGKSASSNNNNRTTLSVRRLVGWRAGSAGRAGVEGGGAGQVSCAEREGSSKDQRVSEVRQLTRGKGELDLECRLTTGAEGLCAGAGAGAGAVVAGCGCCLVWQFWLISILSVLSGLFRPGGPRPPRFATYR